MASKLAASFVRANKRGTSPSCWLRREVSPSTWRLAFSAAVTITSPSPSTAKNCSACWKATSESRQAMGFLEYVYNLELETLVHGSNGVKHRHEKSFVEVARNRLSTAFT